MYTLLVQPHESFYPGMMASDYFVHHLRLSPDTKPRLVGYTIGMNDRVWRLTLRIVKHSYGIDTPNSPTRPSWMSMSMGSIMVLMQRSLVYREGMHSIGRWTVDGDGDARSGSKRSSRAAAHDARNQPHSGTSEIIGHGERRRGQAKYRRKDPNNQRTSPKPSPCRNRLVYSMADFKRPHGPCLFVLSLFLLPRQSHSP